QGQPNIQVKVDGENIFSESLEQDRYRFETPMPEVESRTVSRYEVLVDGTVTRKGNVIRRPEELNTPADYVDTMMGVAHSRWMIAPGPWMPFSMVKLSPDNQNAGWQAGYDPTFESIGTFSHI